MTDIVWKTDEHTQQRIAAEMAEIREPKGFLGDMNLSSIPGYLEYLAMAGRRIAGMAIYMEPGVDLRNAMRVLEMVEEKLVQAKKDIESALAGSRIEVSGEEIAGYDSSGIKQFSLPGGR